MYILNESFDIDYLRLRVHWIRNMKKNASFAFDRIRIPYTLIWLVLDGRLQLELNGNVQWAVSGDIIMCPPGTLFSLIPRNNGEKIHYLSLCTELKIGNIDLVSLYGLPLMAHLPPSDELTQWVGAWESLVDTFNSFGNLVNAKTGLQKAEHTYVLYTDVSIQYLGLQGFIYQWMRQWMNLMRDRLPDEPLRFDQRVLKVCDYVSDRLHQPLRLQELAEQVHVSTSQLHSLFTETLGTSPMEYVRRSRMESAKQMLMNTSLPLHEIAEKIGYQDQSQLSRAFQQLEGISPSLYRRNSRQSKS